MVVLESAAAPVAAASAEEEEEEQEKEENRQTARAADAAAADAAAVVADATAAPRTACAPAPCVPSAVVVQVGGASWAAGRERSLVAETGGCLAGVAASQTVGDGLPPAPLAPELPAEEVPTPIPVGSPGVVRSGRTATAPPGPASVLVLSTPVWALILVSILGVAGAQPV